MQQDMTTRIRDGMDLEDADGDPIGSISKVYYPTSMTSTDPAGDAYLQVGAGLFGLTGHWYIPMIAVRDVVDNRVILREDRSKLSDLGWDQKPEWITD